MSYRRPEKRKRLRNKKPVARQKPPKVQLNQIVVDLPERTLKDSLRLALHQNGVTRKLAMLSFRPMTCDLHITLPYLPIDQSYCGILVGRDEQNVSINLETDKRILTTTHRPKLTYHESGEIHVRPQIEGPESRVNLVCIQATPIRNLRGEHIFTLELDGVDSFAEAKEREIQNAQTLAISINPPTRRVRIVGYAGYSFDQVSNKYGNGTRPSVTIRFARPELRTPLMLALYWFAQPTLRTDGEKGAIELAICGHARKGGETTSILIQGYSV